MHGDMEVSTRNLARALGTRSIQPCTPQVAQKHSGYQVGGTSPFGLRKPLPIYAEETIQLLPELYINAGRRGLLVCLSPADLARVLEPTWVQVGINAS
jgi:Cys-tRNA(Pro) deacylase